MDNSPCIVQSKSLQARPPILKRTWGPEHGARARTPWRLPGIVYLILRGVPQYQRTHHDKPYLGV